MNDSKHRAGRIGLTLSVLFLLAAPVRAQQKNDEEYTKLIKQHLQDPRITTELVDHLPASATVPTPLKAFGHIIGAPGEIEYAKDLHRYLESLAKASPRAKFWTIGKTEEGRDMVLLAIADEATIKTLDQAKANLAALGDPRKTTEAQARQIIKTGKPIYWLTSGMHSPETGGPQMLMELAYRLIVEETPFVQAIRSNVITFITPVIEVDGRERQVDTYYYGKKTGKPKPPLMYWGKYVAHDNNRDGMGQFLKLTQNVTKIQLEWHPTVMHDLHEAQSYLYASTGTGPYNEALDAITINEWNTLANHEVSEMAKRGVPGVFTYGFYDGWVPNYMFFIAHSHNAIGRFYEVQSYGPDIVENLQLPATTTSREWFRPNPPLPSIKWGPRNNTNIQESAALLVLNHFAKNRETYLENYWLKNKRSVDKGKNGPVYGWVIPAGQRRKADTADAVNEMLRQGLEIHRAGAAFKAGTTSVEAGDYVVRADQPYRTLADMYFGVQNYPPQNPRPYDDTGWTFQLMRNIKLQTLTDKSVLDQKMTPVTGSVKAPGGIEGSGSVLVVEHTSDNNLITFRYKHKDVAMAAAEEDFELSGKKFRAGAIVVKDADRAKLEPTLQDLGLSAWATGSVPSVKTHDLDIPRIGYIHAWQRTQDEGWVRAALDTYGIPYTYFADQKLRDGGLRAKYDVIIYPHVGGTPQSQVNGIPKIGEPVPYKKSDITPNFGVNDSSDDIRGGMGMEGLSELAKFVQEGGTLITEGSTATIFPDYGITSAVSVEHPAQLFVRGSILRSKWGDRKSPLAYGYDASDLPVYFNQDPVLNARGGGIPAEFAGFLGGANANAGLGQNITPMAVPLKLSALDPEEAAKTPERPQIDEATMFRQMARRFGVAFDETTQPRVVLSFPGNPNDMLLSGTIANGQFLSNRAAAVDVPLGKGHVVMFALRPFWRWQTQGTFALGFNAILNWNDLDAGKPAPAEKTPAAASSPQPQ